MVERYRRAEEVAFRQIGDECLLVPIRTRPDQNMDIFTLNPLAAFVWHLLSTPMALDEVTERVTATFDVEADRARRDVEEFVQRLLNSQLAEQVAS